MAVRNHVTYLRPADAVAKATDEQEQKVTAELKKDDPNDAAARVQTNTVDGNASGIKYTTAERPTQEAAAKQHDEGQKKAHKATKGGPNPNTQLDSEEK